MRIAAAVHSRERWSGNRERNASPAAYVSKNSWNFVTLSD